MSEHVADQGERLLPSLDDLAAVEHGFDPQQVAGAFEAFLHHIARIGSELNGLKAREDDPGWMSRAARREAVDVIRSAVELAEKIEREAHAAAAAARAAADEELRRRTEEADEELRRRHDAVAEREQELATLIQENERHRDQLVDEARAEATELKAAAVGAARSEAEQLLEHARDQAEHILDRARQAARELFANGRSGRGTEDTGGAHEERPGPAPEPELPVADTPASAPPAEALEPSEEHDGDRSATPAASPPAWAPFPHAGAEAEDESAAASGAAPAFAPPPVSPHDLARALGLTPHPAEPEPWSAGGGGSSPSGSPAD